MKALRLVRCLLGTLIPLLMLFGGTLHHHDSAESEEHCVLCTSGAFDRRRNRNDEAALKLLAPGGRGGSDLIPLYAGTNQPSTAAVRAPGAQVAAILACPATASFTAESDFRAFDISGDVLIRHGPPAHSPRAPPREA